MAASNSLFDSSGQDVIMINFLFISLVGSYTEYATEPDGGGHFIVFYQHWRESS